MPSGYTEQRGNISIIDDLDRGFESGQYLNAGKTTRVSPRAREINWEVVRQAFVLGKRKMLEDGIWVSEDYSYLELCEKFKLKLNTVKDKACKEGWSKIRKAYLARVNSINIGHELGLYSREQYQAEISALNAVNKLGVILDRYIENKFSEVLNKVDDTELPGDYEDDIFHEYDTDKFGNKKPIVELSELKDAVKVATDIYNLQKKIYDNAPASEREVIEEYSSRPKFRSPQERAAKIAQLEAKLKTNLSKINSKEPDTIDVESKEITNVVAKEVY